MAVLGGAWTPVLIWKLSGEPRRFGELHVHSAVGRRYVETVTFPTAASKLNMYTAIGRAALNVSRDIGKVYSAVHRFKLHRSIDAENSDAAIACLQVQIRIARNLNLIRNRPVTIARSIRSYHATR